MKKYKILRNIFVICSLILSHKMCVQIAYNYASMQCAVLHKGFSAPESTAFLFAIPGGIEIIICLILALVFHKKFQKTH